MKIGMIGLGLIGGSLAKSIVSNTDSIVFGKDINSEVIKTAIKDGVLSAELTKDNASEMDMLIVTLYPKDVVDTIKEFVPYLKKGCIVIDSTGVKEFVCNALSKDLNVQGIYFIGGHPMAGKEVSGYENSDDQIFKKASMILCRDEYTNEEAFKKAAEFFENIGFLRITETTPKDHDKVIAFTSQMAHVVSNGYIKTDTLNERYGFSAGSFKDLTRVAKLNEYMWADLFLYNREALLRELDIFMDNMEQYRTALREENKEELIRLLGEGRVLKETDNAREEEAMKNAQELRARKEQI